MKTAHSTKTSEPGFSGFKDWQDIILSILLIGVIGVQTIFTLSCSGGDDGGDPGSSSGSGGGSPLTGTSGTFTEGNKSYKWVKIGEQYWMAQNLNDDTKGKCYGEGGQVNIGDDVYVTLSVEEVQDNCAKYGRLYDWATAMALDPSCNSTSCASQIDTKHKGICPSGWHIPSYMEWNTLLKFVDGEKGGNGEDRECGTGTCYRSSTAGKYLKAASGWNDYEGAGNGTDTYGFSALPSGRRSTPHFSRVGNGGYWWSASEDNEWSDQGVSGGIASSSLTMDYNNANTGRASIYKTNLYSVRCIRN
jgi:uncharacterized protein (TIGR02145 family)